MLQTFCDLFELTVSRFLLFLPTENAIRRFRNAISSCPLWSCISWAFRGYERMCGSKCCSLVERVSVIVRISLLVLLAYARQRTFEYLLKRICLPPGQANYRAQNCAVCGGWKKCSPTFSRSFHCGGSINGKMVCLKTLRKLQGLVLFFGEVLSSFWFSAFQKPRSPKNATWCVVLWMMVGQAFLENLLSSIHHSSR